LLGETPEMERVSTDPLWFVHYLVRVHIDGAETDGAFTLMEMQARRFQSPLHVHHKESETFYVLEGTLRVHIPGRSVELGPGDAFYTPIRTQQMYEVTSDTARWLVLAAPAGFENHIRSVSRPAERPEIPVKEEGQGPLPPAGALNKSGHEILGPPGTMPTKG
jgi:mannose-6-phosphate isomerase-like protein (cupin superfamily)